MLVSSRGSLPERTQRQGSIRGGENLKVISSSQNQPMLVAPSLWPPVPSESRRVPPPAKKRHGKQAAGWRNTRLAARGGCLASCAAPCVGRAWRRASHRASPYLAVCIAPCVAVSGVVRRSLRRPCLATCVSPCVARVRRKGLCSLRAQARRPRRKLEIHSDVSHSRQLLEKNKRLVRYDVNTVIAHSLRAKSIACSR